VDAEAFLGGTLVERAVRGPLLLLVASGVASAALVVVGAEGVG
jgi:hypothetical protein